MTYDQWKTTDPEIYVDPPLSVDPRDEAYTEACEEIDRLKKLLIRAADALETYPTWGRPGIVRLIGELRKIDENDFVIAAPGCLLRARCPYRRYRDPAA
jgi:hypothetical protein